MPSLKDYLEQKRAERPALAPRREPQERQCCERCDGEVFLISKRGEVFCAGCGAALKVAQ